MKDRQAGILRQIGILFRRDADLLAGDKKRVAVTMVLPIIIGLVITMVTNKDDMGNIYESTRATLFTIICAGIYVGMFNSLPLICKERQIIKREYMTGMSITAYILAMSLLQAIVSLVQTLLFLVIYWKLPGIGELVQGDLASESGAVNFMLCAVSLFLIMFAADMIGMLISAIVRSNELANLVAPIIIIFQLVMSGVLFKLTGIAEKVAYATVSKWGMKALGSLAGLNGMKTAAKDSMKELMDSTPGLELPKSLIKPEGMGAYKATAANLHEAWLWMLGFSVLMIVLAIVFLKRVEKDKR